jgi:hypothetical protein
MPVMLPWTAPASLSLRTTTRRAVTTQSGPASMPSAPTAPSVLALATMRPALGTPARRATTAAQGSTRRRRARHWRVPSCSAHARTSGVGTTLLVQTTSGTNVPQERLLLMRACLHVRHVQEGNSNPNLAKRHVWIVKAAATALLVQAQCCRAMLARFRTVLTSGLRSSVSTAPLATSAPLVASRPPPARGEQCSPRWVGPIVRHVKLAHTQVRLARPHASNVREGCMLLMRVSRPVPAAYIARQVVRAAPPA